MTMKKYLITMFTVAVLASAPMLHADAKSLPDDAASISKVCSVRASCQDDPDASVIWSDGSKGNPYDVVWDYGEDYAGYVDACDWSLIFDADFYMEKFPMLALQYHYDEDLLLMHYQTVGIHEGRQASKGFNPTAYMVNSDKSVQQVFGTDPAPYCIYYMMHYDTEKSVDTVERNDGGRTPLQYKQVLTWYQSKELEQVNAYREEKGAGPVRIDSEMSAFASYRAYLNAHEGYEAHDWLLDNYDNGNGKSGKAVETMVSDDDYHFSENTVTMHGPRPAPKNIAAKNYYKSKEHREAMLDAEYVYIGISNMLFDTDNASGSQFDVFMNSHISTPTNH